MFQDEGRFGRLSRPARCLAPKGIRPVLRNGVVREYTYAFSDISPADGVMESLILPWVNAETMGLFLATVSERHPEEFILMVLDGGGWHIAGDLVVPPNMRLLFLPPYSPELNPVEHLWDHVREKHFANRLFHEGRHGSTFLRPTGSRIGPSHDPKPLWVWLRKRLIIDCKLVSGVAGLGQGHGCP